ncbi:MAG: glycolate oxidase subunit GlcE [Steroidobacteraceae bacterium]
MATAAGQDIPVLRPRSEAELVDAIVAAVAAGRRLEVVGRGALGAFGRPVDAPCRLDVSGLTGIVSFEPGELVVTVRAGTPLDELEALLAGHAQCLAFEPPDLGPLLGAPAGGVTVGGIVATGISGPRRFKAGAVRDHVLGARAVSGRGELFVCGGKVVKNVTGYDLPKLLVGSLGTLAVLSEVTLKVVPAPVETRSLLLAGLSPDVAVGVMTRGLHTAAAVSGACHLPGDVSRPPLEVASGLAAGASLTALRVEGSPVSVNARLTMLRQLLPGAGQEVLERDASMRFWRAVADVAPFAGTDRIVWRLSVPPARGGGVLRRLLAGLRGARGYLDWAGGLVWLELADDGNARTEDVRGIVAENGGHATLVRAPPALRRELAVFQPPGPVERRIVDGLKRQFDPQGVLNAGRMYAP